MLLTILQTKQSVSQLITYSKAGAIVGQGVTVALNDVVIPGAGTTSTFNGYLKGIITGVSTDSVNSASTFDVKIVSRVTGAAGTSGNLLLKLRLITLKEQDSDQSKHQIQCSS